MLVLLMIYSVLAPTERHKKRRMKKNRVESADAVATRKKRKAKDIDKRRKRRLRDLPTFASAEQYTRLIDGADEENL